MRIHQICEASFVEKMLKDNNITKHVSHSTGLDEESGTWYGWSHRAVVGFKIGNKIFEPDFGDDNTDFTEHGSKPIKTLADAKQSAKAFADYVS